jgi:alpha-tubulin suppressor-like RCC1 family protein/sugar lactone lactonase YvrE
VTPSGEVSTLVASLPNLSGLAVSADGTSYVSSWNQHTISKVSPAGVVSVLAGAAGVAGTADGQAGAARFNGPKGLAFDPAGNLYVSDFWNRTIRRIDPAGNVSTFAGAAGQQGSTDGTGADARFSGPGNLAIDSWGTLYVSDGYNKVRRITPDRRVTTVQDPAKKLNLPYGLAADAFGNIWVADWSNSAVYRIKPDRSIVLVAGAAQQEGSADGAPEQARFFHLNDLARDAAGALLVADSDNNTIRRIVVPGLPQIAAQPADQTIASGQPLTLTVAAANSAGVVYQWVKDGAALPGATQATYTLPAAQAADGGSYVVMVGNAEGSVTSRRARVTVGGTIVEQPVGRTVYAGQAVEFSVGAVGAGALAYQWTKDGVNLPGAINATLRLAEVGPTDAGRYAVVVSHQGGTLTSGGANLIVNPPVVGWTGTAQGTLASVPADLGGVRQIAAGYEHALALRVDGTVATWGSTRAALAVPAGLTGVIAIAASNYLPVSGAVKNDGSVVLWGDTLYYGPLTVPGGLNNVRQIAIGETEFLALRADGTVFTHSYGQTTIQAGPAGLTGVVAIAKGRYHNLALKSDGTVVTWGALSVPPPAGLSGVVAIAAGGYFAVALKGDGTVVAWGDAASAGNGEMVVPPWLAGVRAIAASVRYTLALKSDGQVVLWGRSLAPVAPTKPPAGFPKELTAVSLSDSRRLALVGKGPFVSLPPLRIAAPGANNTLTASLTGAGEFSVQWLKDGSPVPGATTTTLSLGGVATDAGKYQVVATGPGGTVTSDPSTVVQVSFSHGYGGRAYRAGEIVTFNNQVTFAGAVTSLKWAVLLPAGWSFAGARGGEGDVKPAVDSTDLVDWTWTTPPSSPTNFAYDLRVPAGATGRQEVVALLTVNAGGTLYNFVVRPDPLYLWEVPAHHSADTNRDGRLGLTELTRVIELYNTRTGTTRTGAYRLESNTEDGFAAEPGRTGTASGVLAVYHGADADRDARLSLVELTRVIELYNYRSGTVRTGQYRAQDTTEDGFAPGP